MTLVDIGTIECYETLIARKKKDPSFDPFFSLEAMQDQVKTGRIWLEYHRGLIAKYKRAARYPWLPVDPDEPDPNGWPDPNNWMNENEAFR